MGNRRELNILYVLHRTADFFGSVGNFVTFNVFNMKNRYTTVYVKDLTIEEYGTLLRSKMNDVKKATSGTELAGRNTRILKFTKGEPFGPKGSKNLLDLSKEKDHRSSGVTILFPTINGIGSLIRAIDIFADTEEFAENYGESEAIEIVVRTQIPRDLPTEKFLNEDVPELSIGKFMKEKLVPEFESLALKNFNLKQGRLAVDGIVGNVNTDIGWFQKLNGDDVNNLVNIATLFHDSYLACRNKEEFESIACGIFYNDCK